MTSPKVKVKIIAVGVSAYKYLTELPGTVDDVSRLRNLLVDSDKTALFDPTQYIEVIDPSIDEFRMVINDYISNASLEGELLIFYYSGHGVPIGRDDFGFCSVDTEAHPQSGIVYPLSMIKFSDLLRSLSIRNITPIFIVDACYSGTAGRAFDLSPSEAIETMRDEVHSQNASKYALLTACSDYQVTIASTTGSLFSHYLFEIANGIIPVADTTKKLLSLQDIFPELEAKIMSYSSGEITPRLYLGATLPEFPFVKNVSYSPRTEFLAPYLMCILRSLWNEGDERELAPNEILELCEQGAYGNHNKLSLTPWSLVENNPATKKRRLTKRGQKFLLGELELPKKIELDPKTNEYRPSENTEYVSIRDYDNNE